MIFSLARVKLSDSKKGSCKGQPEEQSNTYQQTLPARMVQSERDLHSVRREYAA